MAPQGLWYSLGAWVTRLWWYSLMTWVTRVKWYSRIHWLHSRNGTLHALGSSRRVVLPSFLGHTMGMVLFVVVATSDEWYSPMSWLLTCVGTLLALGYSHDMELYTLRGSLRHNGTLSFTGYYLIVGTHRVHGYSTKLVLFEVLVH